MAKATGEGNPNNESKAMLTGKETLVLSAPVNDLSGAKRPAQDTLGFGEVGRPHKAPKSASSHPETNSAQVSEATPLEGTKERRAVVATATKESVPQIKSISPRDLRSDGPKILDLSLEGLDFLHKLRSTTRTKHQVQWRKRKDLPDVKATAGDGHKSKVSFADHRVFMDYYNGEKMADYELITSLTKAEVEADTAAMPDKDHKKALRRFVRESTWDQDSGRRVSTVDDPWTPKAIHLLLKARYKDKRVDWGYPITGSADPDDSSVDGDGKKAGYLLKRVFPSLTHQMAHRAAYNRKGGLFNMRRCRSNGRHVTDPSAFADLRDESEDTDYWLENRFLQYVLDRPHSVCCIGVWHSTTKADGHHKCRCLSDLKELVLSSFYPASFPTGKTYGYKGCKEPAPVTKFTGDLALIPDEFKRLLRPVVEIMVAVTNMNMSTTLDETNVHRLWMQSNLVPHGGGFKGNKLFTVVIPDFLKSSLRRFVGHITFCFGVFREMAGGGSDLLDHRFSRIYKFAFGSDKAARASMEGPPCRPTKQKVPPEADKLAKLYTHERYYRKAQLQLIFLAQVALMTNKGQSSPADLGLVDWVEVHAQFVDMFFGYQRTMTKNGHRHDMRGPDAAPGSTIPRFPKGTFHRKWILVRALFDSHMYLLLADHRLSFPGRRSVVVDKDLFRAGLAVPSRSAQTAADLHAKTCPPALDPSALHRDGPHPPTEIRVRHVMIWTMSGVSHVGFELAGQPGIVDGPKHPIDTGVFQSPFSDVELQLAAEKIKQQSYRECPTLSSGQNAIVGQYNGGNIDFTMTSSLMDRIRMAVATLSRQPEPEAADYHILETNCSFRVGVPNPTKMTVDIAHCGPPPGPEVGTTIEVIIPCTDHGCFVRLWPELKAHDKESHVGTVVHVRLGSMLVMPGTMIRGFGISGSMNGNPMLHISVRVCPVPSLANPNVGSNGAADTATEGFRLSRFQKWWYFLPAGRICVHDSSPGRTLQLFPEPEEDDDKLFWYDNHWFHHFWETLCL